MTNDKQSRKEDSQEMASIISIEHPFGDYHIFKIKPPKGFHWKPAENIILRIPEQTDFERNYRFFSIASLPEDEFLLFGTRTGHGMSDFKKALLSLEPGSPIMIEAPWGRFKPKNETSPLVLYAGGVGITPFRALILSLANSHGRPIEVVYSSSDYHLFGDDIEAAAEGNPDMTLHMLSSKEETQETLKKMANKYGNYAYYFLSSSPQVVKSVKELLVENGIFESQIVDEAMEGYE